MVSELNTDLELEIGHVLFIEIVPCPKRSTPTAGREQARGRDDSLAELNRIVERTDAFRTAESAGKLIQLPTGAGMALAFASTPDAPVRCAMQISKALRSHSSLKVKMGVHSGPVRGLSDFGDRSNVTGAGINVAKRIMDCGEAGHILISKRVAEDLAQYRNWPAKLYDLGDCELRHGEILSVVNLYNDEIGNSTLPNKFKRDASRRHAFESEAQLTPLSGWNTLLTVVSLSALAVAMFYWLFLL